MLDAQGNLPKARGFCEKCQGVWHDTHCPVHKAPLDPVPPDYEYGPPVERAPQSKWASHYGAREAARKDTERAYAFDRIAHAVGADPERLSGWEELAELVEDALIPPASTALRAYANAETRAEREALIASQYEQLTEELRRELGALVREASSAEQLAALEAHAAKLFPRVKFTPSDAPHPPYPTDSSLDLKILCLECEGRGTFYTIEEPTVMRLCQRCDGTGKQERPWSGAKCQGCGWLGRSPLYREVRPLSEVLVGGFEGEDPGVHVWTFPPCPFCRAKLAHAMEAKK